MAKANGFLPHEIAAKYEFASENLLSCWHQLKVEMDIMLHSNLIDTLQQFMFKYDLSSDSRASEEFWLCDIFAVTRQVSDRAQKNPFKTRWVPKTGP